MKVVKFSAIIALKLNSSGCGLLMKSKLIIFTFARVGGGYSSQFVCVCVRVCKLCRRSVMSV